MQWWCAARSTAWSWSWQAYPGVWLFVLAIAALYVWSRRRWLSAGDSPRDVWFVSGLLCLWAALDWPIGALGAGYLASVHMLQFLLIALIAPALLLRAVPAGRPRFRDPSLSALMRPLTHPLITLIIFNVVIIVTHIPSVVDGLMTTQIGSFAIDMAWLLGGTLFWWPVLLDRPERSGFGYPLKIGYLILATMVNAGTFIYLTFSRLPVYATYELAPPVYGIPARDDQRVAGLLMKVGSAVIMWAVISILFFAWHRAEEESTESAEAS